MSQKYLGILNQRIILQKEQDDTE